MKERLINKLFLKRRLNIYQLTSRANQLISDVDARNATLLNDTIHQLQPQSGSHLLTADLLKNAIRVSERESTHP